MVGKRNMSRWLLAMLLAMAAAAATGVLQRGLCGLALYTQIASATIEFAIMKSLAEGIRDAGADRSRYQTVSVLRVCRLSDAKIIYYIGAQPDLEPTQLGFIQGIPIDQSSVQIIQGPPGEHAEMKAVNAAISDAPLLPGGYLPMTIYASNNFCGGCLELLRRKCAMIFPPFFRQRGSKVAVWVGTYWTAGNIPEYPNCGIPIAA